MIPGVGKAVKDIDIDDNAFKKIEAIIFSMTVEERRNPDLINGKRRERLAKGSGNTIQDVNAFHQTIRPNESDDETHARNGYGKTIIQ
jgi:signal recognition particle GTPase